MAIQELRGQTKNAETLKEQVPAVLNYGYREVPTLEQGQMDVLEQLQANLAQLEDLGGRLRFVMNEVRTLAIRSE